MQNTPILSPRSKQGTFPVSTKRPAPCCPSDRFYRRRSIHGSLLENFPNNWPLQFELVFTKTVLIHIAPRDLDRTYKKIYSLSKKYILICEYYNPVPVKVVYRNFKNKLFKRDFAGDLVKKYNDLSIIDYGFIYRNDPYFPQDDVTWFLLKKNTK